MSDGNPAGRVLAFALLAGSAVLSYQAWTNAKLTTETMDLGKQHACDLDSSCIVKDAKPRVGAADVFRHRYEFDTTHGVMTVTCKRELVFFGEWACTPEKGRMISDPT
ncbi:hypothetical protein [Enhygromyxa salina]|uniref:hypothetical protein n=1 Tax=Enhygromyxa salina TaxID=215803 RepID=UPI0011BA7C6C|nr:hypothetical protein [Enhygromyxa salina]